LGAELRWILLGLSVPLLAAIWWWTARRSGQAPGDSALRESTAGKAAEAVPPVDPPFLDTSRSESRDWGVPPFEPLNIRTADFDRVPVLDGPMMVNAGAMPLAAAAPSSAPATAPVPAPVLASAPVLAFAPAPALAQVPELTTAFAVNPTPTPTPTPTPPSASAQPAADAPSPAPATSKAAELQRIVTIRVCAVGEERWPGAQLMAALELHGLAFGRYQVFHRKHADGRSLFCVASLIEPGTFDIAAMAEQEFRGVTMFAVLPGPTLPLDTLDELYATARGLAEELSGVVQDAKGMPLSPQHASALREDVAHFQASLPRY
jgi:cell division protein ZipA